VEDCKMKKAAQPSPVPAACSEQLSLLPTPEFSPKWPSHATIAGRVLNELLHGEWLDHQDLIEGASSWRLAAYVKSLKYMGWPIESFPKHVPSKHCPSRCISIYALPPAVIAQVQEMRGAA